jgi:orotate phosphoribosyltransferase
MLSLPTPVSQEVVARETAKMLLEINAVHFNPQSPFTFTSGWKSPVYVDCRKIISYPRVRSAVTDFAASVIVREIGYEAIDFVTGGETAGIPFAALIAERLVLPMQYVRKKSKGFGRDVNIEGNIVPDSRAILVEDLTTDGRSKVHFCETLRAAGIRVDSCFVVFHYDIFPESRQIMKDLGVKMVWLASWWDVLEAAKDGQRYDAGVLREIEAYLNKPAEWSAAHGGIADFSKKEA